jgi:hypothetical protein
MRIEPGFVLAIARRAIRAPSGWNTSSTWQNSPDTGCSELRRIVRSSIGWRQSHGDRNSAGERPSQPAGHQVRVERVRVRMVADDVAGRGEPRGDHCRHGAHAACNRWFRDVW